MPSDAAIRRALEVLGPMARAVSEQAHAPYSGFHVGAALRTTTGALHAACNVESASFGLTQCAERNALGTAISEGVSPGSVDALVVYLPGPEPLPPCGACRQVMAELMAEAAVVVAICDTDQHEAWAIEELLPNAFLGDGIARADDGGAD